MPKPESRLQNSIITALKNEGGWWMKTHGNPMQKRGVPDIVGCYKGRFVAFEVKMPHNKHGVTELQQYNIHNIKENGGVAKVIYSVEDALKTLSTIL